MHEYLNQHALETWSDEDLDLYHASLRYQIARLAIFEAQVQAVWDARYPKQ
jgi:hypothetical protein